MCQLKQQQLDIENLDQEKASAVGKNYSKVA
jgi:hypothetical protein